MLLKVQDKIVFSSKLPKALRQLRGENGCSSSKRSSGFVSAPVPLEKAEAPGKDSCPWGQPPSTSRRRRDSALWETKKKHHKHGLYIQGLRPCAFSPQTAHILQGRVDGVCPQAQALPPRPARCWEGHSHLAARCPFPSWLPANTLASFFFFFF